MGCCIYSHDIKKDIYKAKQKLDFVDSKIVPSGGNQIS